jgi:hypothetical protein
VTVDPSVRPLLCDTIETSKEGSGMRWRRTLDPYRREALIRIIRTGRTDMQHLAWRALATVLGTCIAGVAAAPLLLPRVTAAADDVLAWQKLWQPAFKPALGARIEMDDVQRVGERFAIVGADERGAVVWWSDDGIEWTRSPSAPATDHGVATSIVAGPDGYVLGGRQWTPRPRGRIWYSADGQHWQPSITKLPPNSSVSSVAALADGTFVIYGDGGRRDSGCWMGTSVDSGRTWDFRWEDDWDPGVPGGGGCVTSVVRDGDVLLGRLNLRTIGESADGITWHELVSAEAVGQARPKGDKRYVDLGLVPLDDGRYLLGSRGKRALVWSREGRLERIDGPADMTGRRYSSVAVGPTRAVAVRQESAVPWVSPPSNAHTQRWARREPVCRPQAPRMADLAAMSAQQRLACYGGRELTFEAWIPFSEYGGSCGFGAPEMWMICEDYLLASGPGWTPGYLHYGRAPDARMRKGLEAAWGAHVLVTGHFDDPAATLCPEPGWTGKMPQGWSATTKVEFVAECRHRFIVTAMRRIGD